MTDKKPIRRAARQTADQSVKGGVLGLLVYLAQTNNIDPGLVAAAMPVVAALLAWVSTKIGDPELACLFIPKDKNKPST